MTTCKGSWRRASLSHGFVRLNRAVPASRKKERHTARRMRLHFRVQRLEVHLEQRPEQHRHGDKIEEEPRRRCEALRGEGWQRSKLVGLRQLAQQVHPDFGTELTRRPAD